MVFEKFSSADLSTIAREKSYDYLLIMYMQKFDFRLSQLPVPAYK